MHVVKCVCGCVCVRECVCVRIRTALIMSVLSDCVIVGHSVCSTVGVNQLQDVQ